MKRFNDLVFHIINEESIKINKSLIFEEVYINELFSKLLNFCYYQFIISDEILKIDYTQLINLIDPSWNGINHLSKMKQLWILSVTELDKLMLTLTDNEIIKIKQKLNVDDGIFISDLNFDKNIGIIIINDIPIKKYKEILMHELIHFFQWNTGKSIYDFVKIYKQINVSEEIRNC